MVFDYDAVICFHEQDADLVMPIIEQLERAQLRIASWPVGPATPWSVNIGAVCDRSAACVLVVGPHSAPLWEDPHIWPAISARVERGSLRLVVFHLHGVVAAAVPMLTHQPPWIEYSFGSGDNERAFALLVAAIAEQPAPGLSAGQVVPPTALGMYGLERLPSIHYFQARPELAHLRAFWADAERAGVLALVGIGGSGKTALLTRFLAELTAGEANLPPAEGIFAWSFYDEPDIERFMQELWCYLTRQPALQQPARDLTYRVLRLLEQAVSGRLLLVLDGLEVVQEERDSPGGFGLLRDSSLRHLVRRIARGDLSTRVLMTSRFPFPDLLLYRGSGYQLVETNQLDESSARQLLRSRGVLGDDTALDALIAAYGSHAMTLDYLGLLIHDFCAGDPGHLSAFLQPANAGADAAPAEPGAGLGQILAFYAHHLPPAERAVLDLLCVYRVAVLESVVMAVLTGERKGREERAFTPLLNPQAAEVAITGLAGRRLLQIGADERHICTVHPAIRAVFAALQGSQAGELHDLAGWSLFPLFAEHYALAPRQLSRPALAIVEEMLYHHLQCDEAVDGAFSLYRSLAGGYQRIGWVLADYQRGLRMTELFLARGGLGLEGNFSTRPALERGLYVLDLGRPVEAEAQLRALLEQIRIEDAQRAAVGGYDPNFPYREDDRQRQWIHYEASLLQSIVDTLLAQGKLVEAHALADQVVETVDVETWLSEARRLHGYGTGSNPFGRRASARALLGQVPDALADFELAERFYLGRPEERDRPRPAGGYHTALHADLLVRLGRLRAADALLARCNSESPAHPPLLAAYYALLRGAIAALRGKHAQAFPSIERAQAWAIESGQQEVYARSTLALGRLHLERNELERAHELLDDAESVARDCGFRIWLADTLIAAAHLQLRSGVLDRAGERAAEMLALCEVPECGYGWGLSAAYHLHAELALRHGDRNGALEQAEQALQLRRAMFDPRQRNTERLLQQLC